MFQTPTNIFNLVTPRRPSLSYVDSTLPSLITPASRPENACGPGWTCDAEAAASYNEIEASRSMRQACSRELLNVSPKFRKRFTCSSLALQLDPSRAGRQYAPDSRNSALPHVCTPGLTATLSAPVVYQQKPEDATLQKRMVR